MNPVIFSQNLIRVGVLVLTGSENLLDDVGQSAWYRSGGGAIEEALPSSQFSLLRILVLPGRNQEEIASILRDWSDAPNRQYRCRVILTVGGDGQEERDIAPEATRNVIDLEMPELAERLRQSCIEFAADQEAARSSAAKSHATVGARRGTLIVNLPCCVDSPAGAIEVLKPLLQEALASIPVLDV